jgi:hypothetical protein
MLESFMSQQWFQILGELVLIFTGITAVFPDRWVERYPILGKLWPIFNWLAGNIFNNINHPKGMAGAAEVEKEIAAAKKKVAERTALPDVLDGM